MEVAVKCWERGEADVIEQERGLEVAVVMMEVAARKALRDVGREAQSKWANDMEANLWAEEDLLALEYHHLNPPHHYCCQP